MAFHQGEKICFRYIVLVGLCFICYCDKLDGEFVFDDSVAIVKNRDVTNLSSPWINLFLHDFWGHNLTDSTSHKSYRPLTTLMFRYENRIFSLNSFEMKITNLVIHCINTCLLHKFYSALTSRTLISFTGAAIFAVHPIHTEAVSGIVGRAELMFCFCYLLCLIIFSTINFSSKSNLALVPTFVLLFVLSSAGVLFKETAITILPACIAYDITIRTNLFQNFENRFRVKRVVFSRCGILAALTILILAARLAAQKFESPKFQDMDNPVASSDQFLVRILSQQFLYVLNFWLLLCPDWLSFDWAFDCVKLLESYNDIRCLGILAFYVTMYYLFKKTSRLALLSLALLIVPFLPASGMIRVGFVIAERVLYVPSIGFCLLVAIGFSALMEKFYKIKYVFNVLLFLLIVVYVLRTRQRAEEWLTGRKLFNSALKVCPENAKVHYNIAKVAVDAGDVDTGFKHYHKAIGLYPKYDAALMNLGNLYREVGNYTAAEIYLRQVLEITEESPVGWMNLGIVLASQKKYEEALTCYKKALTYRKLYSTCLYNLGNLYLDMQNYSLALSHWHQAVSLDPKQTKAWANILAYLDSKGHFEDALRISEKALSFNPLDASILFTRANVQGKLKNYVEAEELYNKVIKINPNNALYYANLGVLYHRWGKKNLAMENYEKALKLNRNLKSARQNLLKLMKNS